MKKDKSNITWPPGVEEDSFTMVWTNEKGEVIGEDTYKKLSTQVCQKELVTEK